MVVENKAGASGSIGGIHVMKSAPEGYTLLFTNNAANGAYEQLNPKAVACRTTRDFAPVALFGISPSILVRLAGPCRNAGTYSRQAQRGHSESDGFRMRCAPS